MILMLGSFILAQSSNTPVHVIEEDTVLKLVGWNQKQANTPRWALLSDSYTAVANSPSSVIEDAKEGGCIGIIIEIVDGQYSGRAFDPVLLKRLRRVCAEKQLILAADETLTAIRCGAPFAFQREEYADVEPPDLAFFGRAMCAHGIAINFAAPFIRSLGIARSLQVQAVRHWQNKASKPVLTPVLVQALALVDLAVAGDFPVLSWQVGKAVRDFIVDAARKNGCQEHPQSFIGGLDSLIFVRKDIAEPLLVMGASTAGPWIPWVRWFPRLEVDMSKPAVIRSILGTASKETRQNLSRQMIDEGSKPKWCFWCGSKASNKKSTWCQTCCVDVCDAEGCVGRLSRHNCLT
ncbi:hypothetical protein BN1723_005441 [Verticillium longisporum]|uniref:Uncharacterized protein n=1 Tax=Verticillium longisporum TaxID=100787 RepID=A0A0G4M656_VERLO|nr:hypothetical protein BN1708_015612 [Verticillium longisporum]CRK42832.1 hypothetical protein BN1723_005441 [Verticillium longisporum]